MQERTRIEKAIPAVVTEVDQNISGAAARSRWNWNRIRAIAFWATTFVVVFELTAGSVWNLLQIEWVRVQLSHLGYPDYFAYISGAWHVGGAAVIIAPRFPRLKEW